MNWRSDPDLANLRLLKMPHLRLLAEVLATGRLGLAAERCGLAQPAASRMMGEIEGVIGHKIHERDGRGLRLTPAGAALARRAQRIQLELMDAARDMAAAEAGSVGHVRVGSVTGPSLSHVMPVLRQLRQSDLGITVEVVVATSDALCEQVLSGRLDFALGRVPASLRDQMTVQGIGNEPLGLVVRRGHPLLLQPRITMDDLLRQDWLMSDEETLLAKTVLRWLANAGHPPPRRWVATSSFLFTLAMLRDTDAIAPLARPVVESFANDVSMPYVEIPFVTDLVVEAYGSFHRRDAILPPAAARVLHGIHTLAGVMAEQAAEGQPRPATLA